MRLEEAPSNVHENGSTVFEKHVKPAQLDLLRVGAHYAISCLFEEYPEKAHINCYTALNEIYNKVEAGRSQLATGKAVILSNLTWEEETFSFAVLHMGDHNIDGGVRRFQSEKDYELMENQISEAFARGSLSDVILLIKEHFGENTFSVWHLFKDQQRKIINKLLQLTYDSIENSYRQIYENNYIIMNFLQSLQIPLPRPLAVTAEHITNIDLQRTLEPETSDLDRLRALIRDVDRWSLPIETDTLGFVAGRHIDALMGKLSEDPDNLRLIQHINETLELLDSVNIKCDLRETQNTYFSIGKALYEARKETADAGDASSLNWIEGFRQLGTHLQVKFV
jgi:hypothetical protein